MPTYEMPTLIRVMNKPQLRSTLKRIADSIFRTGGFIRKIENLGQQHLPCKASAHGHVHKEANQFLFYFDVPPQAVENISDQCRRDIDIIRTTIIKQTEHANEKCTIQQETLPPAYRSEVQKMIEIGKAQERRGNKFKHNTGLDYYPFQR